MKTKSSFIIVFICLVFNHSTFSQIDTLNKPVAFAIGFGFVLGNDYRDVIKSRFSEFGGLGTWVNLEIGVNINPIRRLIIYPNIKWLVSRIKISYQGLGPTGDEDINFILVYGFTGRFMAFENRKGGLYLEGGIGFNSCNGDTFKFESAGIGKQAFIGYDFGSDYKTSANKVYRKNTFGIKAGLMWIPVKINSSVMNEKDFGGFSLTLTRAF